MGSPMCRHLLPSYLAFSRGLLRKPESLYYRLSIFRLNAPTHYRNSVLGASSQTSPSPFSVEKNNKPSLSFKPLFPPPYYSWRGPRYSTERLTNSSVFEAHTLVSSQCVCSKAIFAAADPDIVKILHFPQPGEIIVTPGYQLACSHVLHTCCSMWDRGNGEVVSELYPENIPHDAMYILLILPFF